MLKWLSSPAHISGKIILRKEAIEQSKNRPGSIPEGLKTGEVEMAKAADLLAMQPITLIFLKLPILALFAKKERLYASTR